MPAIRPEYEEDSITRDNWSSTWTPSASDTFATSYEEAMTRSLGASLARFVGAKLGEAKEDRQVSEQEFKDGGYYRDSLTNTGSDFVNGLKARLKDEEIKRQKVLQQSPKTLSRAAVMFGGALAGDFVDPLNWVIPVAPVTKLPTIAKATKALSKVRDGIAKGTVASRAFEGAVAGGLVATAYEFPINKIAQFEQADYDHYDSLMNIATGAVFGSILEPGIGFIGDIADPIGSNARNIAKTRELSKTILDNKIKKVIADKKDNSSANLTVEQFLHNLDDTTKDRAVKNGIESFYTGVDINVESILKGDINYWSAGRALESEWNPSKQSYFLRNEPDMPLPNRTLKEARDLFAIEKQYITGEELLLKLRDISSKGKEASITDQLFMKKMLSVPQVWKADKAYNKIDKVAEDLLLIKQFKDSFDSRVAQADISDLKATLSLKRESAKKTEFGSPERKKLNKEIRGIRTAISEAEDYLGDGQDILGDSNWSAVVSHIDDAESSYSLEGLGEVKMQELGMGDYVGLNDTPSRLMTQDKQDVILQDVVDPIDTSTPEGIEKANISFEKELMDLEESGVITKSEIDSIRKDMAESKKYIETHNKLTKMAEACLMDT